MGDGGAVAFAFLLVAPECEIASPARHRAGIESKSHQRPCAARPGEPTDLPLTEMPTVHPDKHTPALAHGADVVKAACLVDRPDLAPT
jgi:hypothetical protein